VTLLEDGLRREALEVTVGVVVVVTDAVPQSALHAMIVDAGAPACTTRTCERRRTPQDLRRE
jgi:hypothetical protein